MGGYATVEFEKKDGVIFQEKLKKFQTCGSVTHIVGENDHEPMYRAKVCDRPRGNSTIEAPTPTLVKDALLFLATPVCLYAMDLLVGGAIYLPTFPSARTNWSRLLATVTFTAVFGAVYVMYAATQSIQQ